MGRILAALVLTLTLLAHAGSALAACADSAPALTCCSLPVNNGPNPTASDCLFILRAAIDLETCAPACICDTNSDLRTTATDALICLKRAVGQPVPVACPCAASSTSTTIVTTTSLTPTTTTTVPSTSTTSSSTTTVSVVTTTSTTTTTTLLDCTVRFRLTSTDPIGGVVYEANYQLIFGVFVGSADAVECASLAEGAFQFNDNDATKILTTGYTNALGLAGPADLADCTYRTNDAGLAPSDFRVTVTDATAPDQSSVDATVEVSSVACD